MPYVQLLRNSTLIVSPRSPTGYSFSFNSMMSPPCWYTFTGFVSLPSVMYIVPSRLSRSPFVSILKRTIEVLSPRVVEGASFIQFWQSSAITALYSTFALTSISIVPPSCFTSMRSLDTSRASVCFCEIINVFFTLPALIVMATLRSS